MRGGSVAEDCLNFRLRGSNPLQSRRIVSLRLERQPQGLGGNGGLYSDK